MPPPNDGNEYKPFVELMKLEKINDVTYRSIALPFSPGGDLPGTYDRAYGGHVYAQAAWAACSTVADGMLLHNVTGNFILPGQCRVPFVYKVHQIRNGRSYSTRIVNVTQSEGQGICFTCICSFKRAESSPLEVQEDIDLWSTYASALQGKKPSDFEECPGMDIPWYWKFRAETGHNDKFPGLESMKADMSPYNKDKHPFDKRGIIFYRTLGEMPADANLHLVAHLYASDRNSLYIVANQLDMGDLWKNMSSLIHSTVFHSPMEDLWFGPSKTAASPMDDTSERGRWFAKVDWSDRAGGGRAMFHSRISNSQGKHVATLMQDGLIRFTRKAEATQEEIDDVKSRQSKWKPRAKL